MITLVLCLMLILSIGLIAIMAVAVGWWLIPLFICCLLIKSIIKALQKLVSTAKTKKDDIVIMSKSELEANYVKKQTS